MGILIPILTGLLLLYAGFQSKKTLYKNVNGEFSLRLNKAYKWVGIICCFIGSLLLNLAFIHWNEEIYLMAPLAILMFFGIGSCILIWYQNYEVLFNENKIKIKNWQGKEKVLKWSEIEDIKFNSTSGYLKLYSKSKKHIIHQHSVGFMDFLKIMELKTKFRKEKLKIPL